MKFNLLLLILSVLLLTDVTWADTDLKLHDSFKRELRRVVVEAATDLANLAADQDQEALTTHHHTNHHQRGPTTRSHTEHTLELSVDPDLMVFYMPITCHQITTTQLDTTLHCIELSIITVMVITSITGNTITTLILQTLI